MNYGRKNNQMTNTRWYAKANSNQNDKARARMLLPFCLHKSLKMWMGVHNTLYLGQRLWENKSFLKSTSTSIPSAKVVSLPTRDCILLFFSDHSLFIQSPFLKQMILLASSNPNARWSCKHAIKRIMSGFLLPLSPTIAIPPSFLFFLLLEFFQI